MCYTNYHHNVCDIHKKGYICYTHYQRNMCYTHYQRNMCYTHYQHYICYTTLRISLPGTGGKPLQMRIEDGFLNKGTFIPPPQEPAIATPEHAGALHC